MFQVRTVITGNMIFPLERAPAVGSHLLSARTARIIDIMAEYDLTQVR